MKTLAHALLFIALVACMTGCGIKIERIPTALEIRANDTVSKFLIEPSEVYGDYQNIDVDSVVFYYLHNVSSESVFWDKLATALKDSDWKPVDTSGSIRRFERQHPKGTKMFSSAEQIRVGYKRSKAAVAYVQADSSKESAAFSETSEAEWAERVIWPKFEALLR